MSEVPASQALLNYILGHWRTQAIGAAARLGIPDVLAGGAKTSAEIASARNLNPDATLRLMRALASFGVFEMAAPDKFKLTTLGELLRTDVPGSLRDMAILQTSPPQWLSWGKLSQAVKTGAAQAPEVLGSGLFDWYAKHPDDAKNFSGAMRNLSALVADELANLYPLKFETVVDVGGASGTLLQRFLIRNPTARGIVFDLPHVVEHAVQEFRAGGLGERAQAKPGDFFVSVPPGDLYVLKQILHDWNDEQCIQILSNCQRAMSRDGKVLIVEIILPEDGSPSLAPLFDLNMLVLLPGRERTLPEYDRLFSRAGLRRGTVHSTRSPFSIIEAART